MENIPPPAATKAIVMTNTIAFRDFLKHNFVQQYKTWLRFICFILVCMVASVGYSLWYGSIAVDVLLTFFQVFIFYFFLATPTIMYFQVKKYYRSNKFAREPIRYTFTQEGVAVEGETFSSTFVWKNFYKIEEIKDWLLIYTDKYAAIRLQKKNFARVEDIQELKELIKAQPVNQKLRQ